MVVEVDWIVCSITMCDGNNCSGVVIGMCR